MPPPTTWPPGSTVPPGPATVPADGNQAHPSPLHPVRGGRTARRMDVAVPWLLAAGTFALRLATAATGPTDWDSAQYAAATGHFDVTHGQPQPPGYWLYVVTGRWVQRVTGLGTVHSLVVVAALASAAAVGLTAVAGRDLGGRWTGAAAGLLVATSPFAWFSGSIVATYSFDMVTCALLIILAWRARPGSRHGLWAVVALGLLGGFRQSDLEAFALVALVAVVASTRTWARLGATVLAGLASIGVWLVPMSLQQPGGFEAWLRATHAEAVGAAQSTSILDHAPGGPTNLGTFAAYTVIALGPLALCSAAAIVVLAIRNIRAASRGAGPGVRASGGTLAVPVPTGPGDRIDGGTDATVWRRPWYQSRAAVLGAAMLPPMALTALVEFAKGGYLLAYLPAAVIALLLPLAAVTRRARKRRSGGRHAGHRPARSPAWTVVASLAVVLVAALGMQRFLGGSGVLPARFLRPTTGGLWLQQARYQAPYADTRTAIAAADGEDAGLAGLAGLVDPRRDVIVLDTVDGGDTIFRNAGWVLPSVPIALIQPGGVLYRELHGALYYASGRTVAAGPGGSVYLVASPALPGLDSLVVQGAAIPVAAPHPIGGYRLWRVLPGTTLLGVDLVQTAGTRPLGRGIPLGGGQ